MNPKPISEAKSADLRNAPAALARAAQAAREIAKQFNMPIVIQQNGKVVKLVVQ
jgi:hypothetical protein